MNHSELTEYINNRYLQNAFINNITESTSNITVLCNHLCTNLCTNLSPFFSIVIPIHNQSTIIKQNIESILKKKKSKLYELILILDACSDNTEQVLLDWYKYFDFDTYNLVVNILILKSEIPLFETSADNLGFYCSSGEYCLEIQADMEMTDYGYNMKLLQPFLLNENIIGISGRCGHSFMNSLGIGKLGKSVEKTLIELPHIDVNSYYITETCNRGPLLLNRRKLKELGYLDETNYFLDNSDHDLFCRANIQKNWICGYVPIDFNSPLINGSTRKPRDEINEKHYQLKKQSTCNGMNGFLRHNAYKIKSRPIQQYALSLVAL